MSKIKAAIFVISSVIISYLIVAFGLFPKNEVKAWTITDEPVYVSQIRGWVPGPYSMDRPTDLDVDSSGNIYVSDTYNHIIRKYNSSGTYIKGIGSYGTGDGQFNYPRITIVGNYIYVAEYLGNRIDKFTLDGTFVTKWGSSGSGDSEFNMPTDIAVSSNYIYVMDSGNDRVQKFDLNGNFISKWGSDGTGDLQFRSGQGIAVDASGNVYTTDTTNRRVQKFDGDGAFITKWGASGSANGQFLSMGGIVVDKTNSFIYVCDTGNYRVQKFDLSGVYQTKWGSNGIATGQFFTLYNIALSPSGDVYTVEDFTGRVQKFTSDGTYISYFGERVSQPGQFFSNSAVFADSNKNVYVAGGMLNLFTGISSINVFSQDGTLIDSWGTYGTGQGQFGAVVSRIMEDHDGLLFIGDSSNSRIQVVQKDGTYVRSIGSNGTADGQLKGCYGFDMDSDENLYVADFQNHRIQVFDHAGNFLRKWGGLSAGTGDGQFNYPYATAVDKTNGWVYVADGYNNRIQKFDLQGNFLTKWTTGPATTDRPQNLTIDSDGYVYYFNTTVAQFIKFDSDGNEVMRFGHGGPSDGGLQRPQGYYWSSDEMLLYVADAFNNRIQVFSYDRTPATFDITTGGDGKVHVGDYVFEQLVVDDKSGVTGVQLKVDGHGNWITCNPKDGSWGDKNELFTCSLNRQLGDGIYTVQLKSTDSFTNTGTVLGVSVAVDTKADDLRVTKVGTLTNTLNSDHLTYYYSQTSLTITGTAEPYSTVTFKVGGHTYTTTAGANGSFSRSFNDNQLDLGTNDVTYYYTDMAGNKSDEKIITLVLGEQYYPTWLTDSGKKEDLINDDEDAQPNNPPTDNTNNNDNNSNNGNNSNDSSNDGNPDKDSNKSSSNVLKKLSDWFKPSCCLLPLLLIILIAVILYYNKRRKESEK